MSKTFRAWDVDQAWVLPPSPHDFVPAGHLAHFLRETVREALDLSAILGTYTEDRGQPPYHPAMLVARMLYGYSRGLYSSRQLARACQERLDVMAVTGLQRPDFRTISDFRKRHLAALGDLFVQVLRLCRAAGLVRLGHVAIDGTKMRANANRNRAMSYGRMAAAEAKVAAEVAAWFARAEAADTEEDAAHGRDRRGDEMPAWVAEKQRRIEAIRAARAALEAEAAAGPDDQDPDGPGPSSGMRGRNGCWPDPGESPPDAAQRNFTDLDSRIQPNPGGGVIAGYNAGAAVDAAHGVIFAQAVQTNPADFAALIPLVAAVRANLAAKPREVSADTGFASEANLEAMAARRIRAYLAPGRACHGDGHEAGARHFKRCPRMAAMAETIQRAGYRVRSYVCRELGGSSYDARVNEGCPHGRAYPQRREDEPWRRIAPSSSALTLRS